jgi:hypothetical protein
MTCPCTKFLFHKCVKLHFIYSHRCLFMFHNKMKRKMIVQGPCTITDTACVHVITFSIVFPDTFLCPFCTNMDVGIYIMQVPLCIFQF